MNEPLDGGGRSVMSRIATSRLSLAILATAMVGLVVQQAIAASRTRTVNTAAPRVTVRTVTDEVTVQNTAFTPLTQFRRTVPLGWTARFFARFSGESRCTGAGFCSIRILVDGKQMLPEVGRDFAFDTGGSDRREIHSMERLSDILGPGQHTIQVQAAVGGAGPATFRLDDYMLAVEMWRVS